MPSALEVITASLRIAGVLGRNEVPDSAMADSGLSDLNDFIDSMNLKDSFMYTVDSETFNLVSGQHSYTVGTSGDFNTARPIKINSLVINQGDQVYQLVELNEQDYANLSNKDVNIGIPEYYYFDHDFPLATLYLFGAPSSNLTITFGKLEAVNQFANLTTQYTFPPGYNRLFKYGMAKELAHQYGFQLTPDAREIANKAMANVKNKNLRTPIMKLEIARITMRNSARDILSGQ